MTTEVVAVQAPVFAATQSRDRDRERDFRAISGGPAQLLDVTALSVCLALTISAFYFTQPAPDVQALMAMRISVRNLGVIALCWAAWTICLWTTGMYYRQRIRSFSGLALRVIAGTSMCSLVTASCLVARHSGPGVWKPILFNWAIVNGFFLLGRVAMVLYARHVRPLFRLPRRVLIVGTGRRARRLAIELEDSARYDYEMLGFVDFDPQHGAGDAAVPTFGSFSDLEEILMRQHIDEVFIALPVRSAYNEIADVIAMCERTGVQSQYLADFFQTSITKRRRIAGDESERIVLEMVHDDNRRHIKRIVDLVGAIVGLVALSPLFLVIAIAIKCTSEGPIIFKQVRYGLNKRKFYMFKFRSMVVDAEKLQAKLEHRNESGGPTFKIKHDPRITAVGRILRKTSMDELPQLINVLFGQMSLVGPRPLPMRDVNLFSELSLMRRFSVKPGMTGLWQVSGRSNTSFTGWISLDLHYIDHWSLGLDLMILLRTVRAVVRGTGAA
jgi:exopolysaccharide biosynthesis polyprenyl glycosylphosphotransferase